MKSLPAALTIEKNRLATAGAWVVLLEITLTDDDSTVLRFAYNTEDVVFEGNTYTAFPFEIEATKQTSKGEIPTVTLRVSNVTRLIQPYLEELDGGVGSVVKITVVSTKHLTEDYSELEMTFDVLATQSNARWVTFTLGAPNPLRQRFPLNQFIALHCRWRVNSVECGLSDATCDRTLTNCRENANSVRFGGFPAMRSGAVKVV